ncbi:hypothetical protein R1sor_011864 [Riccia sorocarpa]|uniref:Beta-glucuronosyltransferase GlcAT14B n=1 Tax=Riccia sorocarpa TaxID=122646 RepID=A0ABD3I271_9MARC
MKKLFQIPVALASMERKWLVPLIASSFISITLFLAATVSLGASSQRTRVWGFLTSDSDASRATYVEDYLVQPPPPSMPAPPRLGYVIQGTKGDGLRLRRVLQALYHPRNHYVLHLDLEAPARERVELARSIRTDPTLSEVGNVHVVGKANLVTYRGPTMVAATLHAAAILIKQKADFDWFINLSASDYPLITQDDLLHVLSYLPRDLNFIEHTSNIGWKEFQRAKPIIVDPGLYMNKKSDIFWATQRRPVPTAFRLFTGSAWFALTRAFVEYTVVGWDNLPRIMLMYYTNFVSSPEGYFHTLICNAPEFRNTTVNHDLHYIAWDNPPKQHPLTLTMTQLGNMTTSGAAFARKFPRDDPVLDKIDEEYLGRAPDRFTPGGWCLGPTEDGQDPCAVRGDINVLKPGPGAKRFESLILRLLSPSRFRKYQCVIS